MSTGPLKYGLPLRPPTASTALWAHILRQDTQPSTSLSDAPIVVPPVVPLDKNATSMRVLLHDTQANFEKFAVHVGKLIEGVNETKNEIKTTNDLFERDRETLMGDIIDLVNRSQKEILKSVGSPCQITPMETYFKDVNHRLETLDQRLDAIQAFNQTHSQAIQTQIQAIQILLDKQGTIVSAVLPLLPLLQAVPLHIEASRNTLNDAISKLALTQKFTSDSPDRSIAVKITGKRKRSQGSSSSSPFPESPSKRTLTGNVLKDAGPTAKVQSSLEKGDATSSVHQHRPFDLSNSSMLKSHGPHEKSPPLTRPADTSASLSRNSVVPPSFSTPRKPLSDLLVHPSRHTPAHGGTLTLSNTLVYGNSVPRSNTTSRPAPSVSLEITPTAARPPRMLRVHASIANNLQKKPMARLNPSTTFGPKNRFQPNDFDILTTSTLSGPGTSAVHKAPSPSPAPAPFPASRINYLNSATDNPQDEPKTISQNEMIPRAYKPTATHVQMPPPNEKVFSSENCPIACVKGKIVPTAVALGNMKETPKIGRRFIPLTTSSEDEAEE